MSTAHSKRLKPTITGSTAGFNANQVHSILNYSINANPIEHKIVAFKSACVEGIEHIIMILVKTSITALRLPPTD